MNIFTSTQQLLKKTCYRATAQQCDNPECPEYNKHVSTYESEFCNVCGSLFKPVMTVSIFRIIIACSAGLLIVLLLSMVLNFISLTIRRNRLHWVAVPAGEYKVPSSLNRFMGFLHKKQIIIKKPFFIQTGEVTRAEYQDYMDSLDSDKRKQYTKVWAFETDKNDDADFPAEEVSWIEARDYAEWLSKKISWNLRLPTMDQWVAAVVKYGEEQPNIKTNSLKKGKKKEVNHLLGNLREWSSDSCKKGIYLLLGDNYNSSSSGDEKNCLKKMAQWPGVGFRLVRIGDK